MKIILDNVMPENLESVDHSSDSVWLNKIQLDTSDNVVLSASSGKGKTTFTHLLTGIRRQYSGTILFDGKDISSFNIDDWTSIRKSYISVIYQDLQIFPHLTVIENILIKNNLSSHLSIDEIDHYLSELGIVNKKDVLCSKLSMGQCQRVAIVRSLCQPFKWILMDEPFSHLDNKNANKAFDIIKNKASEVNAAIIITSLDDQIDAFFNKSLNI
tara:strand:+ start:894 stop:1535 length:642 start_codon:yes stop_codon:yes gene_type:complete